ncbi:MAG TPA: efflux RND transporter permease subunit [Acidobacteriota bacterium]
MKLPEFSVKRRVTTSMMVMILVVVGLLSFSKLGLDYFPDLEFPTVSLITTYSGASSEDVENTLTKPLEQLISSVNRVKKVTSSSQEGVSAISVEFEWGTNLDFAAQDVRDQIGLYKQLLPEEASDPLVVKFNMAQIPVVFFGITGKRPMFELKKMIEDDVAPRLERLDGVAAASVFATDAREILVDVDKAALESQKLSLDTILLALRAENVNQPAGNVIERHSDFLVRTLGEFEDLDDIGSTVVGASPKGEPIRLKDIAQVKDTTKESRYVGRIQGQKGVFLIVTKMSGANTAVTGRQVDKELAAIRRTLPPDVEFFKAMDQAEMIQRVTSQTVNNAIFGGLLAIGFIFLFLRNWRPTFIISLAIPLSIVTTFIAFYLAGYTLNLLTLGGLALGIGMLVDNAIVVIENMFRHLEEGASPDQAAIVGTSEVGMAITASTLTTIAVFFPMVFASGITGKMTQGLSLAVSFSLISSLFVALTIVPLFASLLFKRKKGGKDPSQMKLEPKFEKPKAFYRKYLQASLKRRGLVLAAILGLFIVSLAVFFFMAGSEFMPSMDRDMILLKVKLPVGTSLEETDRVVSQVESLMKKQPEVTIVTAQVGNQAEDSPSDSSSPMNPQGPHEGILWVGLKHKTERKLSEAEVLEAIRQKLPRFTNVKFEALDMSQFMTGGGSPVDIKLYGRDLAVLKENADRIVAAIGDVPGLRDITHSLAQGKPEYRILVDRDRASRFGLSVFQVASTVQTATKGRVASRLREASEELDIRVRFQQKYRDNIDEIKSIPIMTPLGQPILLSQVADISRGTGPIQITRENQMRRISVTANLVGRDLGSVVRDVQKRLGSLERELPAGYYLEFGGQYKDMQEAFLILAGAFVLASLLVYMVMASQFESFVHPFVIMFTIPLCTIGIAAGLLISGTPVNLAVLIGVIILAGIAVNNGIVMIDYINKLRRKGVEAREAVLQGSVTRLRPVLATALTTILGMLPMAFSTSAGAEMRAPMAISVAGGLTATTFLTLFIVPIIYSLVNKISFKEK